MSYTHLETSRFHTVTIRIRYRVNRVLMPVCVDLAEAWRFKTPDEWTFAQRKAGKHRNFDTTGVSKRKISFNSVVWQNLG